MAPDTPANAGGTTSVQAGFMGADWGDRGVPDDAVARAYPLRTADGGSTKGILYSRGTPDTVCVIMHPREFTFVHYLVPDILEAGCAAWMNAPRSVGVDLRLEHETALLDLAAGLAHVRALGFRKIVLIGNSGGASLHCFYIQQASLPPAERIARTPGGSPAKLADAEMPVPDGLVLVAPHPGQGLLLMDCIDPSVTNEADALSLAPALDPLAAANGFAQGGASYAPDFVARYRAAQRERVAHLDGIARELIANRLDARTRAKDGGSEADRRKGAFTPVMTVWRTDADLRCFDLSLDPSDRKFGTVWSRDPIASNHGCVGFGRFCTPEAWLSTWSGLSSNAALPSTGSAVDQPALLVEYTGDQTVFPETARSIFGALASTDKRHERVRGNHHGKALEPGEEDGRFIAGRLIQDWLREKGFGA